MAHLTVAISPPPVEFHFILEFFPLSLSLLLFCVQPVPRLNDLLDAAAAEEEKVVQCHCVVAFCSPLDDDIQIFIAQHYTTAENKFDAIQK